MYVMQTRTNMYYRQRRKQIVEGKVLACPKCGAKPLNWEAAKHIIFAEKTWVADYLFRCSQCGLTDEVTEKGNAQTILDAYHKMLDRFNEATKKQVVTIAEQ